jgi:hypothetical protein
MADPYDIAYNTSKTSTATINNTTNDGDSNNNNNPKKQYLLDSNQTIENSSGKRISSSLTVSNDELLQNEKTSFQILNDSLKRLMNCTNRLVEFIENFTSLLPDSFRQENQAEIFSQLDHTKRVLNKVRRDTEGLQEERGISSLLF